MAQCPNCGKHLHIYNWRPECPGCGVNMVYFKSNERLLAESENAEIAHAKSQPSIDRAKASFLGSPFAIARIPLSLIPIAGLLLPMYSEGEQSVNLVAFIKLLMAGDVKSLALSAFSGNPAGIAFVLLALSVVMILVSLGCSVMSLGKHGLVRNAILNGVTLLSAVASAVTVTVSEYTQNAHRQIGAGSILYILLLAVLLVYNFVIVKKKLLKPNYTTCYIGGLPSDTYFDMVEQGCSDLEIRKAMVVELTKMQNEVREAAKKAEQEAFEKRANRKK